MDQRLLVMHQTMLADRPRMAAYDQALARVVRPGDVVADVGAGTLALSLLALRHGAGHVHAVEADPRMVAVAERVIAANDLAERITLVQGDARVARLPRVVNVVVGELMGNLGPEEDMAGVLGAFARRNLRPGGAVVPRRLTTNLAPIEFDNEGWGIWGRDFHGYRLDAVAETAPPEAQLHFFQREPILLGDPVPMAGGDLTDRQSRQLAADLDLPLSRSGELHAVIGYFTADLADGVELANFPSYPGCNWAVWVWPLRHTKVGQGDRLRVSVRRPSGAGARIVTDWRLDCRLDRCPGQP